MNCREFEDHYSYINCKKIDVNKFHFGLSNSQYREICCCIEDEYFMSEKKKAKITDKKLLKKMCRHGLGDEQEVGVARLLRDIQHYSKEFDVIVSKLVSGKFSDRDGILLILFVISRKLGMFAVSEKVLSNTYNHFHVYLK